MCCMLHEVLTGAPPFRRDTPAETMWAHLHDEPPRLPGHPELNLVMAKALAKDKDERHASCRELIADARAALGLNTAHEADLPGRPLVHHRHAVLAAGLLVTAVVVAAAIVVLTSTNEGRPTAPDGTGVAVIGATG